MALLEYEGTWYRIEYGPGCQICRESSGMEGAVYEHADSCRYDSLCSGSGVHPETDCNGTYLPCPQCGVMESYTHSAPAPQPTAHAAAGGGGVTWPY